MPDPGKNQQCFGLFYEGALVAVAIFCNPRTGDKQREYTTELLRIAFNKDVRVQGATSKLIEYFMKLPTSVDFFTYQDTSDETADIYELSGMSLVERDEIITECSIYEWHNPTFRFYTYRISSTVDDSYYYGRHQTKLEDAEAMLNDKYMGSGGVKYRNWVSSVGAVTLRKEIVGVYSTWGESVNAEDSLIGNSHLNDPHCKNSKPGGTGMGSFFPRHKEKHCQIHGLSLHQGESCKKCSNKKAFSSRACPKHGETTFQGENCLRCQAESIRSLKLCSLHGETSHTGDSCSKCTVGRTYSIKLCEVHGEVIHQAESCNSCVSNASISLRDCPIHGEVKHIGDRCRKCINNSALSLKLCPIHGETLHQSDACAACVSQNRISRKICESHGEVKFLGAKCATCLAEKIVSLKICPVHGESKHVGEHCKKCMAAKSWTTKECPVHGESKHNGNTCSKCKSAKIWTTEDCPIHGETKHRSGKCLKCSIQKRKDDS